MTRIDIVLPVYNGADHLAEQLDSLLAQTHREWHLLVRDDGSTDASPQIIESYRARNPDRITVVRDDDGRLGFVQNVARLLSASDGAYNAFCDQDDVWLPDKLQAGLTELEQLERDTGPDSPALVFSDMTVVDEQLTTIAPSFWQFSGIDPAHASDLGALLSHNVVTGATLMINAALRARVLPIPATVVFHDWWIACVCAAVGTSTHLPEPTVRYRQHAANASGAQRPTRLSPRSIMAFRSEFETHRSAVGAQLAQASALLERCGTDIDAATRRRVEAFTTLGEVGVLRRTVRAARNRVLPGRALRAVAFVCAAPRTVRRGRS